MFTFTLVETIILSKLADNVFEFTKTYTLPLGILVLLMAEFVTAAALILPKL